MNTPSPLTPQQAQDVLDRIGDHTTAMEIIQALAAGADPNKQGDSGRTPLRVLMEDSIQVDMEALRALVNGGALPLADDCAFEQAMINGDWREIRVLSYDAMRKDQLTDEGGTVLHAAARQLTGGRQITAFGRLVHESTEIAQSRDLPSDWFLSQVDQNGNTPLHELWANGVAIGYAQAYHSGEMEQDAEGEEVSAHWYATHLLVEHGARLNVPNHAGETVFSLIQQAMSIGLRGPSEQDLDPEPLARLNAALEGADLDKKTETPSNRRSSHRF